jgi:uncharacterized protein with GYD domain
MARYVVLMDWTDQGVRNAKDTVQRSRQARDAFKQMGVELETIYWTLGKHDIVAIMNAADDSAATAAMLRIGAQGNLRSTTMRAFDESEMTAILGKLG